MLAESRCVGDVMGRVVVGGSFAVGLVCLEGRVVGFAAVGWPSAVDLEGLTLHDADMAVDTGKMGVELDMDCIGVVAAGSMDQFAVQEAAAWRVAAAVAPESTVQFVVWGAAAWGAVVAVEHMVE